MKIFKVLRKMVFITLSLICIGKTALATTCAFDIGLSHYTVDYREENQTRAVFTQTFMGVEVFHLDVPYIGTDAWTRGDVYQGASDYRLIVNHSKAKPVIALYFHRQGTIFFMDQKCEPVK